MTSRTPGTVTALPTDWWSPALALPERLPTAAELAGHGTAERARRRFARWDTTFQASGPGRLDQRLAAAGTDRAVLLDLLGEPRESLAGRVTRPAWVETVECAVAAAVPPDPDAPLPADGRDALAVPLRSFTAKAWACLAHRVTGLPHVDPDALAAGFRTTLGRRLAAIAARTLLREINAPRFEPGSDLAYRLRRLATPEGLAGLLAGYPVLARLLAQTSRYATDAGAELLGRFSADRAEIVATLLGGADPGPLVEIRTGLGDTHQRGRSVAILRFADGARVVYKPRDLAAHQGFAAIVNWLNRLSPGLDLRTPAALPRAGYGWLEYVPDRPIADLDEAERFYRRHGTLLALLYAVHASDMHVENLVACGDQPVPVDLETLFHADVTDPAVAGDPAAGVLAASVQRTGLLPVLHIDGHGVADRSALGGAAGTDDEWWLRDGDPIRLVRKVGPRSAPARPDPADHEAAILDGFRLGYDTIARNRDGFLTLIRACADVPVRTVLRHTSGYLRLLDESTHPDLLRDGLDRDLALDLLWTSADLPLRWWASRYEHADLWAHDVPLLSSRPGSTDVQASDGQVLPGVLDRSGLSVAAEKVAGMNEVDRQDQEWIISAALACRRPAGGHGGAEPMPGPIAGTAAAPERLLAAACALGDRLVARALGEARRVNWLGIESVEDRHWMVLPAGAGLANGYTGIALFLAQLAELSGVSRYGEMALRATSAMGSFLDTLDQHPELVAAVGCGGLHGFGGIAYALARLSRLLDDDRIAEWAAAAVRLAGVAAEVPGPPGLASGTAGCLAAMRSVHTEIGLPEAAALADACADRLAELVFRTDGDCDGAPTGFADGRWGIGWALATGTGGPEYRRLAALTVPDPLDAPVPGWCQGVSGQLIALLGVYGRVDDIAVRLLADRPVLDDLSLCHGELGVTEALTVLTGRVEGQTVLMARRRRAGLILDAIGRYGPRCGTPGGVPTPGLLTGLAGIGYGLLRLGFAERTPSVLLLEPTPAGKERKHA